MKSIIDGVLQTSLRQIHDERGKVMHMLRSTDSHFQQFGEVYFSWIYPGIIKAWHKHHVMTMNYAVPVGHLKLVLFDDRPSSPTKGLINEFYLNSENYTLLTIPNGLWYGFKAVGNQSCMIVNCATHPHDPKETERISFDDPRISYSWDVPHG